MGRRSAPVIVAAALIGIALASPAVRATPSDESDFVSRINAERTSRGIPAVTVYGDLTEVARNWSEQMAQSGQISHDPNLPNEVSGWTDLGDCVGRGGSVADVHDAFMNSDEHRSIILNPIYNEVGVGVAYAGNVLYVTEVFVRRPTGSSRPLASVGSNSAPEPGPAAAPPAIGVTAALTGVVWEIDLDGPPLTISILEHMLALDAPLVDPATGAAR